MTIIALVDDENSIRTSVSLALESEGFKVDVFQNGIEALEALESKTYDLGLFDIKMPKMDGNELLAKVRSSKKDDLKEMPIIFLTSKDQEQDEIIGLRMGAADYITKPFSQKLLSERIRTVLRIYQNRKAPTTQENTGFKNLKKGNKKRNKRTKGSELIVFNLLPSLNGLERVQSMLPFATGRRLTPHRTPLCAVGPGLEK